MDQTFDVCETVVLDVEGATAEQRASVADAIGLWRAMGIGNLTVEPVTDAPRIAVVFKDAAAPFHGYYDDERAIVYVNATIDESSARAITIAHELGHAFGLWHIEDRISVMNSGNLTIAPTDEDRRDIEALWGTCSVVETDATTLAR